MINRSRTPWTLDPMVPPGEGGGPPFEVASLVESVGRIQKISPKWLATGHKLYTFPNKPARHLLPTINVKSQKQAPASPWFHWWWTSQWFFLSKTATRGTKAASQGGLLKRWKLHGLAPMSSFGLWWSWRSQGRPYRDGSSKVNVLSGKPWHMMAWSTVTGRSVVGHLSTIGKSQRQRFVFCFSPLGKLKFGSLRCLSDPWLTTFFAVPA